LLVTVRLVFILDVPLVKKRRQLLLLWTVVNEETPRFGQQFNTGSNPLQNKFSILQRVIPGRDKMV
jgi:hypothetical protein